MLTSSGKSLWGRRVVCRLCPLIAAWLICGAGFVGASGTETLPETLDGLRPFCRKVMSWPCRGIGVTATLSIFCDESTPVPDRGYRYGVVYFINGNFPRIGTESDATILRDFLCRDGHWVVVVDFKNHPRAKTPDFDQDLLALYRDIYREEDAGILSGTGLQPPKFFRIFLVPSGYRLATDQVYYDLREHAAPESLAITMQLYNELADRPSHKKFNIRKVARSEDMVDMHGKPLDYRVCYDIIYPGRCEESVPLFVLYNSGWENAAHYPPEAERINLANFLFRGYAYANVHYPMTPLCKAFECYTHRDPTETAHKRHAYAAAIRKLRLDAARYQVDPDRIGVCGVSKSAPVGAILGDPACEKRLEARKMTHPQPWPGVSAHITCVAMFNGNMSREWLAPGFVPAFYGRSELDPYVGYHAAVKVRDTLEKSDIPHLALVDMTDLPHTFPQGRDSRLGGLDRDRLLRRFFDHFLMKKGTGEPELLYHLPLNEQKTLDPKVTPEFYFFPAMKPVPDDSNRAELCNARGERIAGKWRLENGGLRLRFVPDAELPDGDYRMVLRGGWESSAGVPFKGETAFTFTVDRAGAAARSRLLFPVESIEKRGDQEKRYSDFRSCWPVPVRNADGTTSSLTYDLGRVYRVTSLAPQFAQTRWEYAFDVEVSTDGVSWTRIVEDRKGRFAAVRQVIPVDRQVRWIRLITRRANPVNHFFLTGIRIMGHEGKE